MSLIDKQNNIVKSKLPETQIPDITFAEFLHQSVESCDPNKICYVSLTGREGFVFRIPFISKSYLFFYSDQI